MQVLRMCEVGSKLLHGIKSMYVGNLTCARVKGGERERFKICKWVGQGFIMSPWLFNVYINAVMRDENGDGNEVSEIHGGEEKVDISCPLVCG